MNKVITLFAAVALVFCLAGCETTTGTKRENGSNSERIYAKWKNVTVEGNVNFGGANQKSEGASQEGLGRVTADATVEDTLNGQEDLLKDVVKPLPEVPVVLPEVEPLRLGE